MQISQLPIRNRNIAEDLIQSIRTLGAEKLFVGFSGGADSTLLLYLCCQAIGADKVVALHVNHQLSEQASAFEQQVKKIAEQFGCHLICEQVLIENNGQGIEAAARHQRYEIFKSQIPEGGQLLLGHHADDQVETFFLRMFRGAGVHGLQGMAAQMQRDHYQLTRPLLSISHALVVELCQQLELSWIEDASNQDEGFDRNFLRQSVLPLIESRWPGYRDKVLQSMNSLAEHEKPQNSNSAFDVEHELSHRLSHDQGLKLVQLDEITDKQLLSLLHRWLTQLGVQVPSTSRLQAIVDHVIHASKDAQPCVEISGGEIRRHGPALYWLKPRANIAAAPMVVLDQLQSWAGVGTVKLVSGNNEQPRLKADLPNLRWSLRAGGEYIRPYGRSKKRDLKRLFQEYRHKPWLRERTPLLFSGDELVAVGDLFVSADHLAEENELGIHLVWENSD